MDETTIDSAPPLDDDAEDRTDAIVAAEAPERPVHHFDPGALVIGAWFVVVGIGGATIGTDIPPAVVPVSFAVTGLGLLLPKRRRPR